MLLSTSDESVAIIAEVRVRTAAQPSIDGTIVVLRMFRHLLIAVRHPDRSGTGTVYKVPHVRARLVPSAAPTVTR
jgi:hypothetical protein